MRHHLQPFLDHVYQLDDVHPAVDHFFRQYQVDRADRRLGYVAGIITSDGPEQIPANLERLELYTDYLRTIHPFPLFACTDIFTTAVFDRVGAARLTSQEWLVFWRKILHQGHVSDVFMTPRWEVSVGAQDEYTTAQELGLQIHFVPDQEW